MSLGCTPICKVGTGVPAPQASWGSQQTSVRYPVHSGAKSVPTFGMRDVWVNVG